jgi:hypothetical protein
LRRSITVTRAGLRCNARAASIPAKPPPTITTRGLSGNAAPFPPAAIADPSGCAGAI